MTSSTVKKSAVKKPASHFYRVVPVAIVCLLGLAVVGLKVGQTPAEQMQTFAEAYLETLDDSQRGLTMKDFGSPERVGWHFIPKDERKGLMIGDMNDAQRTAGLRLLRSALSEAGYGKVNRIMLLEEVLNEMEKGEGRWERNPQRYFVTLFGDPSGKSGADGEDADGRWGLSFEGHHLSLNFVCRGNEVLDSTPQFLASNPATVMQETTVTLGKGTAVLSREEQLGFKLINALSDEQQDLAVISAEAPSEVRFAGEPQPERTAPKGIPYAELDAVQKDVLKDLVATYTDVAAEPVAAKRRLQILNDGWEQVRFAWAGAMEPGIGHYYRITGKSFLIEFVNTQSDPAGNPANHIHCFYRDLTGDFDLPISQ
ncbi:DUF3500 domain-containing protein [Rhodopirellula sp. SWK7]|uniref:DUF3500 domain-containing protein n=1 Tax=Rhodopirellula sp. SWK7 TaxID=595460 RepID=UPI0002BFD41C|nr:DUF3500 domain-containing protein [Rhodopirellula sp. SWK7]EMI40631.1 hypothetical protein RRSWK_07040 [Rhodopirellula sp. SWK7]